MRISPIKTNYIGFKQKKDTQYTGDVLSRDVIRERLEEKYLGGFAYAHQIDNQTAEQTLARMNRRASKNSYMASSKETDTVVDFEKLKDLKCFCRPKRKNELYSGSCLLNIKEGVKTASEAGIKTIIFLNKDFSGKYADEAKKYGLNFATVSDIGDCTLTPTCVVPIAKSGELLKELYTHPDIWATQDEEGNIKKDASKNVVDLQIFFDILDGNNENYPTPIYYGCDFGSESTSIWTEVYMALKDEDRTKPLRDEVVKKLISIEDDCSDY